MNEFYMDIKKYIKENYSEYKEMSEKYQAHSPRLPT